MTRGKFLKTLILVTAIVNLTSCSEDKSEYILDEPFDDNRYGWVEERTDYHTVEIRNGEYFIHSKDTSGSRSSAGSWAAGYLYALPKQYEITTSITLIEKNRDDTNFGVLLYSASLNYVFAIYSNGDIIVSEYDYNRESSVVLFSKNIDFPSTGQCSVSIKINEMDFELIINDINIGTGTFKTKTSAWYDLRLFTSVESAISIDYLRIK